MIAGHLLLVLMSSPIYALNRSITMAVLRGLFILRVLEIAVSLIQSYVFMRLGSLYARETTSATQSTGVTTMAAVKVDEAVEVVAAEARCADVAVEEKEVVVVVAVEVERAAAGVARGTMTGSLGTTELE